MATPHMAKAVDPLKVILTPPTFGPQAKPRKLFKHSSRGEETPRNGESVHRRGHGGPSTEKHVHLEDVSVSEGHPASSSSSIYMGSYRNSPRQSRGSLTGVMKSPEGSVAPSPRASMSQRHIEHLLQDLNTELETYGVEEYRDGFFDAMFLKPPVTEHEDLMRMAEYALPAAFRKRHPLSPTAFFPKQWHEIKGTARRVTTTRAGIKLAKSFLAFFIAYILCLIPASGDWLGPYNYIMVLSATVNHPGRTLGAQIDGAVLTILGTAGGLGWGALALYISDSSSVAATGYGGILATFLVIFMATAAALRSYFIRSYQMALCAGISVIFTCLADTSRTVTWSKLLDYGIPWLFGQAISLIICCVVFPDAGARPLAASLHDAFAVMQDGLSIPPADTIVCHRQLASTFVNLSQAYRDLVIDVSITRFLPADIATLRNLMQGVVRSLLALKTESDLFGDFESTNQPEGEEKISEAIVDIDGVAQEPILERNSSEDRAVKLVVNKLAEPTQELLSCMRAALSSCDAALLDISGYRKYLGPPESVSSDVIGVLTRIQKSIIKFDEEDDALMDNPQLPPTYSDHPELVKLFLFANPIRQTAGSTEALLVKVMEMQQRRRGWRMYLPSYSFVEGLQRTNAQVRHDRGGLTAGFFFHSQKKLDRMLHNLQKSTYQPAPRYKDATDSKSQHTEYREDEDVVMDRETAGKKSFRYQLWIAIHRLQGFETRFALKVVIVTSLLAVPAWLNQSRGWYNSYQSWWAVIMAWLMMHPRVGGNFQDLVTRSLCGILGAVWGGLAYAAGNGNAYVTAVFAIIYMLPMIYRFTQSAHPRSGIVGCVSFVVVSLRAYNLQGSLPIFELAWTYAVAFVVGVVSAIVVNWILWPFVARHELRKALSAMLFYSAIIYRGVVAKYIYYEDGEAPGTEDVIQSELLEGQLREGFVRIRQLMALTRHEIRLRGPFNPLPYSGLIESCESFFEHLIEVRQASLFFHPNYMSDNNQASEALLPFRRDAVAAILMNLYVLAGALRGNRKVPKYLPSALTARKRLLDRMAELEIEHANSRSQTTPIPKKGVGRKFAEVYQFAYSQALTQCVEQLIQLQKYTKAICGEIGFDPIKGVEVEEGGLMESTGIEEIKATRSS